MKDYSKRFPLPKSNFWPERPDRVLTLEKEVKAFTRELGILILWSQEEYDAIGQWTDADVEARVAELLA